MISNTRSEKRVGTPPHTAQAELFTIFSDWNKSEVSSATMLSIQGDKCQAWE